MFNRYFANSYFPEVWFAPADESHLLPWELAGWDTRQGMAAQEVVRRNIGVTVRAPRRAVARAGRVGAETQRKVEVTEATVGGCPAYAKACGVSVSTGSRAAVQGARAQASAKRTRGINAHAAVVPWTTDSVARAGFAGVSCGVDASVWGSRAIARNNPVSVRAITNPTDEELVSFILSTRGKIYPIW